VGKSISCEYCRWGRQDDEDEQPIAVTGTRPVQSKAEADRGDQGHESADAPEGKWIARSWDEWRVFHGMLDPIRLVARSWKHG
jgi:hypothetical protein